MLSDKETEYILSIKPDQVDRDLIVELFCKKVKKGDDGKLVFEQKYKTNTPFTIPKGRFNNNSEPIKTTIGKHIYNIFILEDLHDIVGYVTDDVTGKKIGEIETKLSKALENDKITPEQFARYLNRLQNLAFGANDLLVPSMTRATTTYNSKVKENKEKLLKKNEEAIKNGDPITAAKIEKELLDIAEKSIGDDPGMDLYKSGSKASFSNNYKNMFVMRGPLLDTATGDYTVSTSNYAEGIKKDEIHAFADSIVNGAHAKGVGTQKGGYITKKYYAAFQSLVLDKKGSNCRSLGYQEIFITKDNYSDFLYRYIKEGDKLISLDDELIKKYIGRKVKMRDPMYCTSDKICNICAGDGYYKLGIENIGLTAVKVSSSLMQKSLKKFHDTSIKLYKVDVSTLS